MAQNPKRREAMDAFFEGTIYEGAFIVPAKFGDRRDRRFQAAGLALAQVMESDGSLVNAVYVSRTTKYTDALTAIWVAEMEEDLPPGVHDRAIDAIASGEFDREFASFLPRQAN